MNTKQTEALKLALELEIETSIEEGGEIHQRITDAAGKVLLHVLDTQEDGVRNALIEMGWTPPEQPAPVAEPHKQQSTECVEPVAWMDGYRNIYSLEEKAAGCEDAVIPLVPATLQHWSDCAVHNEPAYPAGKCDCGGYTSPPAQQELASASVEPVSVTYKEVVDAMNALYMGDSKQVQIAKEMENKKLYTSPPYEATPLANANAGQRSVKTWVSLTDEEIQTLWRSSEHMTVNQVCRAIEAKLKEKNQ